MKKDREQQQLAMAASGLTEQDLHWINQNVSSQDVNTQETSSQDVSSQEESSQDVSSQETSSQEESSQDNKSGMFNNTADEPEKPRKRRTVKHTWPEVGTILQADYEGTRYEAEVVASSKYKSGKAIKILSGPASGKVKSSMSGAMKLATKRQREDNNLGSKGVSNGWKFWKPRR